MCSTSALHAPANIPPLFCCPVSASPFSKIGVEIEHFSRSIVYGRVLKSLLACCLALFDWLFPQVESAGGMEQAVPVATLEPPPAASTYL